MQYIDRIDHKMQRSLKLPQVQYINKIIQKVQQITEVSQQQYMNVDVPAEIQCQNTATHQNIVKHFGATNRFHSGSDFRRS